MKKLNLIALVLCILGCSTNQTQKNNLKDSLRNAIRENYRSHFGAKEESWRLKYSKPISDSIIHRYLEKKSVTLDLEYIVWGCACPPFIEKNKKQWCDENKTPYIKYCFYLEPADTLNKIDKNKLIEDELYVTVTGNFYKEERFPFDFGGWDQVGVISPRKVLRYKDWKIKK